MNPKRILIVETDAAARESLSSLVNDAGYDFRTAIDGSEAVSIARQERPELILLDLVFPPDVAHGGGITWDGFLIIDWLRRMDETSSIPVFLMAADDSDENRNRALAKGAAALFRQPIDPDELLAAIRGRIGVTPPEQGDTVHVKLGGRF